MKDYIKELNKIFKKQDLSSVDKEMVALLREEIKGAMSYAVGSPERTEAIANSVKLINAIKSDIREDKAKRSESIKRIFDIGIDLLNVGGTLSLLLFTTLLTGYLETDGVLRTVSFKEARSAVYSTARGLMRKTK